MGVVALLIAAGCFFVGGWFPGDGLSGTIRSILGIATLVFLLAGVGHIALSYFRWENDRDVLTTRRIIQTQGFINRKAADTSLEKINDALFEQGVIGRIFGFGALDVMTASASGINKMRFLTTPDGLQEGHDGREARARDGRRQREVRRPAAPRSARRDGSAVGSAGAAAETRGRRRHARPPDNRTAVPPRTAPAPPAESAADATETIAKLAALRD